MNSKALKALIGKNVKDAEATVRAAGFEPRTYHEDDVRISLSLPKNVVELDHNDKGIVTNASTQDSIEEDWNIIGVKG